MKTMNYFYFLIFIALMSCGQSNRKTDIKNLADNSTHKKEREEPDISKGTKSIYLLIVHDLENYSDPTNFIWFYDAEKYKREANFIKNNLRSNDTSENNVSEIFLRNTISATHWMDDMPEYLKKEQPFQRISSIPDFEKIDRIELIQKDTFFYDWADSYYFKCTVGSVKYVGAVHIGRDDGKLYAPGG